jgi:hypothetical protein
VKKQDVRETPTLPGSQASKLWLMEAPTACCGKERPGYPRAGRQESQRYRGSGVWLPVLLHLQWLDFSRDYIPKPNVPH